MASHSLLPPAGNSVVRGLERPGPPWGSGAGQAGAAGWQEMRDGRLPKPP